MEAANENLRFRPSDMERDVYLEHIGGVYENSSWIAETLFRGGLTSDHDNAVGLHAALRTIVDDAPEDKQIDLLLAHPDLAGKLAVSGGLTDESTSEQASAGLDQCTDEEFAEFQSLNSRYKEKFKFPYILAVRGRNRQAILENFRTRVENSREDEFAEALKQVHKIAFLRLETLFEDNHS